jgi:hypothetical protein
LDPSLFSTQRPEVSIDTSAEWQYHGNTIGKVKTDLAACITTGPDPHGPLFLPAIQQKHNQSAEIGGMRPETAAAEWR